MKTLMATPISRTLMKIFGRQAPFLVPVETTTYMRPVEIRRYVRHLRENQRYRLGNDFFN